MLASVILVSLLIGSLSALALTTGRQAQDTSTSDRNHDQSLAAAEAGVHEAIEQLGTRITAGNPTPFSIATANPPGPPSVPNGTCPPSPLSPASYPNGTYYVCVTQNTQGYVIDSEGFVGAGTPSTSHFGRRRHIRVQLRRPNIFPNGGKYALFSDTVINLKNNDEIDGNIWANQNITFTNGSVVNGSVTSAQGWVDMSMSGAAVKCTTLSGYTCPAGSGNVITGGSNGTWALNLGGNSIVGTLQNSSSAPCTSGSNPAYSTTGGGTVGGNVTTWGTFQGTSPSKTEGLCTAAPPAQTGATFPVFNFNPVNYGCNPYPSGCPSTYHEFASVADFQSWLNTGANKTSLVGTFWVQDHSPSESNRIELGGANMIGNVTIVTNAPINADTMTDNGVTSAVFTAVSHYAPSTAPGTYPCSLTNHADQSECAIHFKNGFQPSCKTAVLLYADKGEVAIKNNSTMCGSVIGSLIDEQNNWTMKYDDRGGSQPGFGPDTWEIGSWQELASQ